MDKMYCAFLTVALEYNDKHEKVDITTFLNEVTNIIKQEIEFNKLYKTLKNFFDDYGIKQERIRIFFLEFYTDKYHSDVKDAICAWIKENLKKRKVANKDVEDLASSIKNVLDKFKEDIIKSLSDYT
jgi:hypothetical protein